MARNLLLGTCRVLNTMVEKQIAGALRSFLPPLNYAVTHQPHQHSFQTPVLDAVKDFSLLLSKRRQGDIMTSDYIEGEDKGFWNRKDRDLKADIRMDFEADCPRWLVNRKAREWRAAKPRFIEGVIIELMTRKPKKPNSGNRKICLVQVTFDGVQKTVRARIPGENNTLQQHHRVYVQYCRNRNLPTVKYVVVRGQLDAQY